MGMPFSDDTTLRQGHPQEYGRESDVRSAHQSGIRNITHDWAIPCGVWERQVIICNRVKGAFEMPLERTRILDERTLLYQGTARLPTLTIGHSHTRWFCADSAVDFVANVAVMDHT